MKYAGTPDNLVISFITPCTYDELTYMQDNLHDNPYAELYSVELSRKSNNFHTTYIYKDFIFLQQNTDFYVLLYNQYIQQVSCINKKLTIIFAVNTPVEMLIKHNNGINIEKKTHHKLITLSYDL